MKIKVDFITNSSSTAFIVCLPDDWYPSDEDIHESYETYSQHKELDLDFEHRIRKAVDDLRYGKIVHICDDYDLFYALAAIMDQDHVVYRYDSGASEGGYIENIKKEKLLKVLTTAYSGKPFIENISGAVLGNKEAERE